MGTCAVLDLPPMQILKRMLDVCIAHQLVVRHVRDYSSEEEEEEEVIFGCTQRKFQADCSQELMGGLSTHGPYG